MEVGSYLACHERPVFTFPLPEPDWGKLRGQGVDPLFEVAEEARGKLQELVAKAQPEDWDTVKSCALGR